MRTGSKPLKCPMPVCVGEIVDIYFNVHARSFSVRRNGKVVNRTDGPLWLHDATFMVSAEGRDRVRIEGRKNVHAWVRGTVRAVPIVRGFRGEERVKYDPYTDDGFVCTPLTKGAAVTPGIVKSAKLVVFSIVRGKPLVRAFMVTMEKPE